MARAAARAGLNPDQVLKQLDRGLFDEVLAGLNPGGSEMIAGVLRSPAVLERLAGSEGVRQLRRALRAELRRDTPEQRLLTAASELLPEEKRRRLDDARAILALGNLLDLLRELDLLPPEGGDEA